MEASTDDLEINHAEKIFPLKTDAILSIHQLLNLCHSTTEGKNVCLSGELEFTTLIDNLIEKKVHAAIGYSETLAYLELKGRNDFSIIPLPLGNMSRPVVFSDALIISSTCISNCEENAKLFIDFLLSDRVYDHILMGKDSELQTPRYVIPATKSASLLSSILENKSYKKIVDFIQESVAFPNQGVNDVKHIVKDFIWQSTQLNRNVLRDEL